MLVNSSSNIFLSDEQCSHISVKHILISDLMQCVKFNLDLSVNRDKVCSVLFHTSVVGTCLHKIGGLMITHFPCEMGIRHRIVNRIYSWISLANVNRFSYILHTTFFDNIESCKAFAMAKCT